MVALTFDPFREMDRMAGQLLGAPERVAPRPALDADGPLPLG